MFRRELEAMVERGECAMDVDMTLAQWQEILSRLERLAARIQAL